MSEFIVKNCPFCGGEPKVKLWRSSEHDKPYFLIRCSCGARMTNFRESSDDAIADWNRRVNGD